MKLCDMLCSTMSNLKIKIVGDGVYYRDIKKYVDENNLQKNIELIGYSENPYHYYRRSKIFISTAIYEGLGNAVLEALIHNCHILSYDIPGPSYILKYGEYGKLFKVNDYKSIYNELIENKNFYLETKNFSEDKVYKLKKHLEQFQPLSFSSEFVRIINGIK